MYTYTATVTRVVDGDTVELVFDLGFHVKIAHGCRLHGINAPEKNTDAGKAAKVHLQTLLPVGQVVRAETLKDKQEKFGRILVRIFLGEREVADLLVDAGHARLWDGKGARPV